MIKAKNKIVKRIDEGQPQPPEPVNLRLDEIEVIDKVFQHRSGNSTASSKHVDVLMKAIRNSKGQPFEALTVFWVGDGWVLVDGHHRHKAYLQAGYSLPVPVKVLTGDIDIAIGEALQGNSRDKLSMGSREKSNAAWRLVVGTDLSINKTSELSTRSRQTIITMRGVRDTLLQKYPSAYLIDLGWWDAQRVHKGLKLQEDFDDDWMEKQAKELADKLVRLLGKNLGNQPDVLWKALDIYDSRITDRFLENHGIDPEEDDSKQVEDAF